MSFPGTSRYYDFVDDSTPAVDAGCLNAIQDAINGAYVGTLSFKGIVIDGVGGAVVAAAARQISCTGGQLDIVGYDATGVRVTQAVQTSGTPTTLTVKSAAHTTLAAGVEATQIDFDLTPIQQFATGAIANQRAFRIRQPTYRAVAASVFTNCSTVDVDGPPVAGTNVTLTNKYAIRALAGHVAAVDGQVIAGGSVSGSTGPGIVKAKRFYTNGTALVSGDFTIGGNWGAGATATPSGTDTAGSVTFLTAGAPAADPTWSFGFKDNTFTSAPFVICQFTKTDDGTIDVDNAAVEITSVSATVATFALRTNGTAPTAGKSFLFTWIAIGY